MKRRFLTKQVLIGATILSPILFASAGYAEESNKVRTFQGITGDFEITAVKTAGLRKGSEPTLTIEVNVRGTFSCAEGNFYAEALVSLPGGTTKERYGLLVLSQGKEVYALYHDTLNYQQVLPGGRLEKLLFQTLPSISEVNPILLEDYARKAGFRLEEIGFVMLEGIKYLKFAVKENRGGRLEPNVEVTSNASFYFPHNKQFLRVIEVSKGNWTIKTILSNVKRQTVRADTFRIPANYYEMEAITTPHLQRRSDG